MPKYGAASIFGLYYIETVKVGVRKMQLAHPNVEYRLNDLQGMLYAACRLGAWCYSSERQFFMSTASHKEEYRKLLETGGCLDAAMARKDIPAKPFILSGGLGLGWISEWVNLQNGGQLLVVLGPAYLHKHSVAESLGRLDQKGITLSERRHYMTVLGDVPALHNETLMQYACMLHFACYEENLSREDVLYEETESAPAIEETNIAGDAADKTAALANDYARMAEHENYLLNCLADGVSPGDSSNRYGGDVQDFKMNDHLREMKDNIIIFTGLCARRAIRAGVPLYIGKTMEGEWIRRIEAVRSFGGISRTVQEMYGSFQEQIRRIRESSDFSKAVRDCREYIRLNYTKALTTEEIARHCGYTEYYLTRKFAKETGMKLTDYIRAVRLDAARVMLLTSRKDIQQISEELQFGSRSYFDRVFRQEVGMSPRRYRETRGQS